VLHISEPDSIKKDIQRHIQEMEFHCGCLSGQFLKLSW
jgi:hypothetical protein